MKAAVLALVLLLVAPATADVAGLVVVPGGGAAGGPALYLPRGDLLNVRNIEGGVIGDTNLDLGAGSAAHRGDIVLNFDVGRRVLIFDGHKHLIAAFGGSGIRFYRHVRMNRDKPRPKP